MYTPCDAADVHAQEWVGKPGCFVRRSLYDLGLAVQLNHPRHTLCASPRAGPKNFMVVHTTGLHCVRVIFCECHGVEKTLPRRFQLLRYGWWPGSLEDPHTAVTAQCLRQFHILSLQGGLNTYDYYLGLERLTDAARLLDLPVRSPRLFMIFSQRALGPGQTVPPCYSPMATHEASSTGRSVSQTWRRSGYRTWRACSCLSRLPPPRRQHAP